MRAVLAHRRLAEVDPEKQQSRKWVQAAQNAVISTLVHNLTLFCCALL